MNPILAQIESTGTTELPSGEAVAVHSRVGDQAERVIREAIATARPSCAIEVGLAFGVSTLHIFEAMSAHGAGRLIGMDPAQHDGTWRGGGLHNIKRAGYADRYEFIEEASQTALPRLLLRGDRIQFAFIDGWHTFDHTLVDFFFADQMLDVGGVVVLDDVGYPGLRRLSHFIVTNRDYEIIAIDNSPPPTPTMRRRAKRLAQTLFRPLVRDNYSPDSTVLELEKSLTNARLVALRKRAHDSRRFDHFVAF